MIKALRSIISLFILASILLTGLASADEISFEATVNSNIVSLGQSIQLSLIFEGTKSVPAPDLQNIEGFATRYIGPSTRMSIVGGQMSSSITHNYRLVPMKTGKFTVGPFSIDYNSATLTSNQLSIEVIDGNSRQKSSPHQKQQQSQSTFKDKLFLTLQAGKTEAYLNEIIPVTITLYINNIRIKDVQYPTFNLEGFSIAPYQPKQYTKRRGGIAYDVVEFNTTLFGTRAGDFKLGPATLSANLLLQRQRHTRGFQDPFGGLFGRYETEPIELTSDALSLTVLPLPDKDRPADFQGALGNFNINVTISPSEIKAGDPITLKAVITGSGNFATVTKPVMKEMDQFKSYEPQTKQEDGRKTFEQILIPTSDTITEIPQVLFSYFDTNTGTYKTISKGPFPITVLKPDKKETLIIMESQQAGGNTLLQETFGRDIIYIKESPGNINKTGDLLYRSPIFLLLQIIPVLIFAALLTLKNRRDRLSSDIGYARRLKAPRKAGKGIKEAEHYMKENMPDKFYDTLFRTLREYIGNRFHIATGGITADDVDQLLESHNIDASVQESIKEIIKECDLASYAPAELNAQKREAVLQSLKKVIDHLERNK